MEPEVIQILFYPADQNPLFGNQILTQILEQEYHVCIDLKPGFELNLLGTVQLVQTAADELNQIIMKYNNFKKSCIEKEQLVVSSKMVKALKARKNIDSEISDFINIPKQILTSLLAIIENIIHTDTMQNLGAKEQEEEMFSVQSFASSNGNGSPRNKGFSNFVSPGYSYSNCQRSSVAKGVHCLRSPLSPEELSAFNYSYMDSERSQNSLQSPKMSSSVLRDIIIDGSNVARYCAGVFQPEKIFTAYNYFTQRGHKTYIVVPQFCRSLLYQSLGSNFIKRLEESGHIAFAPSHTYDDYYILDFASRCGAVVVSNDKFRDMMNRSDAINETIRYRRLPFVFIGKEFIIPVDPRGKQGPEISEFLKF